MRFLNLLAPLALLLGACGASGAESPAFVGDGPEDPGPFAGGDAPPAEGTVGDLCAAACSNIDSCSGGRSSVDSCIEGCHQTAPPSDCLTCYAGAACDGFEACEQLCSREPQR